MSSSNSTASEVQLDDICIGSLYIVLSLICIFPYCLCLRAMRHPDLKAHSCYMIMLHLGIGDLIQLFGHLIGGILTATQLSLDIKMNKLFGGVTNGIGWMSYMMFSSILAFDRYVQICRTNTTMLFGANLVKVWILIGWSMGVVWFIVYMSPFVNFTFVAKHYVFYYTPEASWNGYTQSIGFYLNTAQLIHMSACYLRSIRFIRQLQSTVVSYDVTTVTIKVPKRKSRKQLRERALMKQAAILCVYTLGLELYFDLSPYIVPQNKYSWSFINILWILNGGVNPLVYFTMNKSLKRKVKEMLE